MAKSKIEWTEKTWNPLAGCSKVSPGCENCYALRMAHRLAGNPNKRVAQKYKGLTKRMKNGSINWTGEINIDKNTLNMKFPGPGKPSIYFVNSMSDLFHPKVPFTFIDSVYEVMGFHTWHTFQVLTKHPERALEYYKWTNIFNAWGNWGHVWLGTSVEDQKRADKRIPTLLQIPAKLRWLSVEPLLDRISLMDIILSGPNKKSPTLDALSGRVFHENGFATDNKIDWVVVGGESGPKARIAKVDWVKILRDQCKATDVPFFFKQWGEWCREDQLPEKIFNNLCKDTNIKHLDVNGDNNFHYYKTGKHFSGRLLDGKLYNEYPKGNK